MRLFISFLFIFGLFTSPVFSAKKYALIIGSNYKGNKSGINELQLCEADATYMESQIKKVGNFDEIKVLLGRDVTKINIEREIRSIGGKASKDDTVFLYFAGHGFYQRDASAKNGMRNFIVCYDRPHLSDDELDDYLKSIKSPKTLFAFDCCYSGGITKKGKQTRGDKVIPIPEGSQGTVKTDDDFFFQNKALISSADDNQVAIEVGGTINHGIFTYHFGKAMETADLNGDKVVTALEAFFKTRDDVGRTARENDHVQTPQISGDASGFFLAGSDKPEPPKVDPTPVVKPEPKPEPEYNPPKKDPENPPVTPQEPPAVQTSKKGGLLIRTSIIKDRKFGWVNLTPEQMVKNRDRKGTRAVKVLIDDQDVNYNLITVKSDNWGATTTTKGEVYNISLKNVPAGVHKLTVRADDYPEIVTTCAVMNDKETTVDLLNSMSGFGAVQGTVYYKTLDNPVSNHPIYMPTIKSAVGQRKVFTDEKGQFWFTNLIPGEYEVRASFAENLDLSNSMIKVTEGEITKIQVILNVKLPGTKTKY